MNYICRRVEVIFICESFRRAYSRDIFLRKGKCILSEYFQFPIRMHAVITN